MRPRIEAVNKALTTHTHNATFFDAIDTEEKAYWMGFIMADGNIYHKDGTDLYILQIGLKKADEGHLIKLKASLNSSHPIYTSKENLVTLMIHSKRLCKVLIKHGVVPRKSYEELLPPQMPSELLRHFFRGYFDGDGSLHKTKNGKLKRTWAFTLLGSSSLLKSFIDWMWSQKLLVRTPTLHPTRPSCKTLEIKLRRETEVRAVTKALYKDAKVYLDRKMEKHLQLTSLDVEYGQLNLPYAKSSEVR